MYNLKMLMITSDYASVIVILSEIMSIAVHSSIGAIFPVILEMIHQREKRIKELLVGVEKCIKVL